MLTQLQVWQNKEKIYVTQERVLNPSGRRKTERKRSEQGFPYGTWFFWMRVVLSLWWSATVTTGSTGRSRVTWGCHISQCQGVRAVQWLWRTCRWTYVCLNETSPVARSTQAEWCIQMPLFYWHDKILLWTRCSKWPWAHSLMTNQNKSSSTVPHTKAY